MRRFSDSCRSLVSSSMASLILRSFKYGFFADSLIGDRQSSTDVSSNAYERKYYSSAGLMGVLCVFVLEAIFTSLDGERIRLSIVECLGDR